MALSRPSSMILILLLLLLLLTSASSALPLAQLSQGTSFSPSNSSGALLQSPKGTFSFGFRSLDQQPDHFYLALWYSFLDLRVVWIANPNSPASASALLSFTSDGQLLLLSDLQDVIWNFDTVNRVARAAELLDTGNLVLTDASGLWVWQSFDHTRDTLLPTQWLQFTHNLTSRQNQGSSAAASGLFLLSFNTTDGTANLSRRDSGEGYWFAATTAGFSGNNSLSSEQGINAVQLDTSGTIFFYNSAGKLYKVLYPLDLGTAPMRRVTLDVDGNLRTYSWDDSSNSWIVVWEAVMDPCASVPELCGTFGVCIHNPDAACICPPGFQIADSTDISRGCSRRYSISCDENIQFLKLQNINYPGNDISYKLNISLEECRSNCQNDCSCVLAAYDDSGEGQCWLKSAAFSGQQNVSFATSSHVKLSTSDPTVQNFTLPSVIGWSTDATFWSGTSAPSQSHSRSAIIAISTISTIAFAELVCLCVALLWFMRKSRQPQPRAENMTGGATSFTSQELETATNHFRNKLGEGGFGTVFRGKISDGRMVAVKRLEGVSSVTEGQFRAEIVTLGKIHHLNLLRLYGFCAEGNQRLLVYELMENGSLDAFLFHRALSETSAETPGKMLNWKTRFAVCLGVARGMTYLHEECLDRILHCDIKPQNILLDSNLCPKVADFGLSYLYSRDATLHVSAIRGTRGYLAPEWLENSPVTAKADVYSFGMVMMEILGGRRNYLFTESALTTTRWCFPEWAFERVSEGKMEEILDPRVRGDADYGEVERVMGVAFLCIQRDPKLRPAMRSVVQMLEGTVPIPPLPASTKLFETSSNSHSSPNARFSSSDTLLPSSSL